MTVDKVVSLVNLRETFSRDNTGSDVATTRRLSEASCLVLSYLTVGLEDVWVPMV